MGRWSRWEYLREIYPRYQKASREERLAMLRELGVRWVDFAGLSLALLLVAGIAVHAVLRKVTKR